MLSMFIVNPFPLRGLKVSHLGHQASGVALLMAVKVLALKVSSGSYDKRFAYRHAIAHLIGIGMMIGKDEPFEPVGVGSDIVFPGYDACKLLDTCIKELSGIVIHQSDTAPVALLVLAPVIGVDFKFACALDVKPFVTDTEIHRSTACQVVLRDILLAYIGCYSHAKVFDWMKGEGREEISSEALDLAGA